MEERSCKVCDARFTVDDGEIAWMIQRDMLPPKRCPDCRRRGLRHRPNGKAATAAHARAERLLSGHAV